MKKQISNFKKVRNAHLPFDRELLTNLTSENALHSLFGEFSMSSFTSAEKVTEGWLWIKPPVGFYSNRNYAFSKLGVCTSQTLTLFYSDLVLLQAVNDLVTELEQANITCTATITFAANDYKEQLRTLKVWYVR